jgi:Inorganic Pyrophosphatase
MADISFDDLVPDAQNATSAPPQPAALSFDDLVPDNGDTEQPGNDQAVPGAPQPVASEGTLASGVRAGLSAVGGAIGAYPGAGAGVAAGEAVAPFLGPLGIAAPVVGGLLGAGVGAYLGNEAEQGGKQLLGIDDAQQLAADEEEHPYATFGAELAVGLGGMNPMAPATPAMRIAGAALGGGMEAGQEAAKGEDFSPAKIAMSALALGTAPSTNKLGQTLESAGGRAAGKVVGKFVPGRPGQAPNPDAAQAHVDVGAQHVETAVGDSSTAQEPPQRNDSSIGNPQSAPQNAKGENATGEADSNYIKNSTPTTPANDMLTQGDMAPEVIAALTSEENAVTPENSPLAAPKTAPEPAGQAPAPAQAPPAPQTVPEQVNEPQPAAPAPETVSEPAPASSAAPRVSFDDLVPTGFPETGEPVAVGENEATPMPKRDAAIAISKANAAKPKLSLGQKKPETIRAAATKLNGKIYEGKTHADAVNKFAAETGASDDDLGKAYQGEGFVTDRGRYVDREEARRIAEKGSQVEPSSGKSLSARSLNAEELPTVGEGKPALEGPKPEPEPTPAQKEAGNYQKGHERMFGHDVSVETEKGGMRRSKDLDENGKPLWEHESPYDYGQFIRGAKGADGDPLDLINLRNGDKHFIVDQKDPETGKFDEHKIIANARDQDDALKNYFGGFGDKKGVARLHDITPVTAEDIQNFVGGRSKSTKKAYSLKPFPKVAKDTKVVTATVTRLREAGMGPAADAIEQMQPGPEKVQAAARAQAALKNVSGQVKKPGAELKNPRIRNPDVIPKVEGAGVTAKSKALAEKNGTALKAVRDLFEKHVPKENETDAETKARAKALSEEAKTADQYPFRMQKKQEPVMLVRAARKLGKDGNVQDFRATEQALRSGDEEAINEIRQQQRAEADQRFSKRTGEEAVNKAEAANAERAASINNEEDEMHERIDTKRDIKSAEDLAEDKGRQLDMENPEHRKQLATLLNKDNETTPKWKAERDEQEKARAEKLARLKAAREAATVEGTRETVPEKPVKSAAEEERAPEGDEELKRLIAEQDADNDSVAAPRKREGLKDMFGNFVEDEEGAGHPQRIARDLKDLFKRSSAWIGKRTDPDTYMPRVLDTPEKQYLSELSDRFHQHDMQQVAHEIELRKKLLEVYDKVAGPRSVFDKIRQSFTGRVKPSAKLDKTLARIYHAREEGRIGTLSAEDKDLYDNHLKGIFDQNDAIRQWIKDNGGEVGPDALNHVHRIVRGQPGYDPLMKKVGATRDPIGGKNNMSTAPRSPLLDRQFVALERSDGTRFVISPREDGYTLWQHGTPLRIKDPGFDFQAGNQIDIGGNKYTMVDANTREIERNARGADGKMMKYYHNAAVSAVLANAQLMEQARNIDFINTLKEDQYFKDHSTTNPKDPRVESGEFVKQKMPKMDQYFVSKKLANIMNDFAHPGFDEDTLNHARALSQMVTKTIFWNPIIHPANVGAHFFVARGWDNFTPKGVKSLVLNGAKAINEVTHPGRIYREITENGGALMHEGAMHPDMTKAIFEHVGEEIKRDPATWDPIAKKFGIGPSTLVNAIYKGSQNITWAANDMFYITRYLEERARGLSIKGAINATEKDIPNYRVAPELLGSRGLSKAMQDPLVSGFGRYHTGMMNAYANMIHGMVHGTGQERVDAVGKLFALAILGGVIQPGLSALYKKITGNPGAEAIGRGPLAPVEAVKKLWQGKNDPLAPVRSIAMGSPFLQAALQAYSDKDFGDRFIIQPGDMSRALHGHPAAAGRVLESGGMFAARTVAPVNIALNEFQKPNGGIGTGLRDQLLGIRNPSPKARAYDLKAPKKAIQDSVSRFRNPHDPIERQMNKWFGY